MQILKVLCLGLVALLAGCGSHDANSDLRLALNTHGVEEVDIVRIPESVQTPVEITPEKLESQYHAKLELRGGALLDHINDLDEAVARTECKGTSRQAGDVRTGVIFLGTGHKRIKSFYYGLKGAGGQIDTTPCELTPGLYQWARKNISD